MAISDWPPARRPRERLLHSGVASLSDAELLALVLRTGVAGKSAVALGHELLDRFGSLRALFGASLADFSALHGLGPAKFAQFQAVFELARRALAEPMLQGTPLNSIAAVTALLQLRMGGLAHEVFTVLFLDVRHCLIRQEELFRGSLSRTAVYPREIAKAALGCNAASVILAHNHPSGVSKPSPADLDLTRSLKAALGLLEVRVLDHIIIAGPASFSFADHGLL